MDRRRTGLLLHPSSLPSPFGIGDLGPAAEELLDWMGRAGLSSWHLLPLGPTGPDGSPMAVLEGAAGNPLLISPERLVEDGLLPAERLDGLPELSHRRVDHRATRQLKQELLRASWAHFQETAEEDDRQALAGFCAAPDQAEWLEDWSLFAALAQRHGEDWTAWPAGLAQRRVQEMRAARQELEEELAYQRYLQFLFARQWARLREQAERRRIELAGTLTTHPSPESCEVWRQQDLFQLDDRGRPERLLALPPSLDERAGRVLPGALYDWDRLAAGGFAPWVTRLAVALTRFDRVRLTPCQALATAWTVEAEGPDPATGEWQHGPGGELLDACRATLGEPPLLAEDFEAPSSELGGSLAERAALVQVERLQRCFNHPDSERALYRLGPERALFTGSEDAMPLRAWVDGLGPRALRRVLSFAGSDGFEAEWDLLRCALTSSANLVVIQAQDLLGLGAEARMYIPDGGAGNWGWRLRYGELLPEIADRLRELIDATDRLPAAEAVVH